MTEELSPRIVRWETPFTDARWPGALLYTSHAGPIGEFTLTAAVMPSGADKYPKYLVHFGEVIAFSCMEEMHFPERDIAEAACDVEVYQHMSF
jgi:hypothetical protein